MRDAWDREQALKETGAQTSILNVLAVERRGGAGDDRRPIGLSSLGTPGTMARVFLAPSTELPRPR